MNNDDNAWVPYYDRVTYVKGRVPRIGFGNKISPIPSCGQCIIVHQMVPCINETTCIHKKRVGLKNV